MDLNSEQDLKKKNHIDGIGQEDKVLVVAARTRETSLKKPGFLVAEGDEVFTPIHDLLLLRLSVLSEDGTHTDRCKGRSPRALVPLLLPAPFEHW